MVTLSGQVLQGARTSAANAPTTSPTDSGVSKAIYAIPSGYPTGEPAVAQTNVLRYGSITNGNQYEYLVWAANNGSLANIDSTSWHVADGSVSIPGGNLTVIDPSSPTGNKTDGTARVVITDNGNRTIGGVISVLYTNGNTLSSAVFTTGGGDITYNQSNGIITLNDTVLVRSVVDVGVSNPVAVSADRGDTFTLASYWIASARFWWTRNDPGRTRFGWNGRTQRWSPYGGSSTTNLGVLSTGTVSCTLSPPHGQAIGNYLPGSQTLDDWSQIRVGANPGATSTPVVHAVSGPFSGILVVSNDEANSSYNFNSTSPPLAGVVGTNNKLFWNPDFVQAHTGLVVWYSPSTFSLSSSGVVGHLTDTNLYVSPVPYPYERPLIRIGNRSYLGCIICDTEAELLTVSVPRGSVGIALSTGKLAFNASDVALANPGTKLSPNPSFDPLYLEAQVVYDGVSLNLYPQPVRAPVQLVDSAGTPVSSYDPSQSVFIPDATGLPGNGSSGIIMIPDGTGNEPNPSNPTGPRPEASGMVRSLSNNFGSSFLFSNNYIINDIVTVPFEDKLPTDTWSINGTTAYVALSKHSPGSGSEVIFDSNSATALIGKPIYFMQPGLVTSMYAYKARLISFHHDSFTFSGGEKLHIYIDGTSITWTASAGTFSASNVATSINAAIVGASATGTCSAIHGHVVISSNNTFGGQVSIGFGSPIDLSGCAVLGFQPGWMANNPAVSQKNSTDQNWLPDSGIEFGFYRSFSNQDGTSPVSDFMATGVLSDQSLGTVAATPYQFLTYSPREDISGYDYGVFFKLNGSQLLDWKNVVYQFQHNRFGWISPGLLSESIQNKVSSIDLGVGFAVPESFYYALGGYLQIATNGPYQYLNPDIDFVVPDGTGQASLINKIGYQVLSGYSGRYSALSNTFTDSSVVFTGLVSNGDVLQLPNGKDAGSYIVQSASTHSVTVTPSFVNGDGGLNTTWSILKGATHGSINPATIADVVWTDFNSLPYDPMEIRLLTFLGTAGGSLSPADITGAVQSNRGLYARFVLNGNTDIPLTLLTSTNLGVIANGSIIVPHADIWFTSNSFSIELASTVFSHGLGNLMSVASFSSDPGSNIEYLNTGINIGQLKFGSTVLSTLSGVDAVYVQNSPPSTYVSSGTGYVDPVTGVVSLSSVDITNNSGDRIYLVENLVNSVDLTVNPIGGSVTLHNPVAAGQIVEARYYQAMEGTGDISVDSSGMPVLIRETLPVFIRRETATDLGNGIYGFNPSRKTIDTDIPTTVWVDHRQTSYGTPPLSAVDTTLNQISFTMEVSPTSIVRISYAVMEATGGETTYAVSSPPVWRPPFNIPAGATSFNLSTDRTTDVVPGKCLRVGGFLTYIRSSHYDGPTDTTTVHIFPPPTTMVGSMAPGENQTASITDRPVTPVVDPAGTPTIISGVDTGFLAEMTTAYGLSSIPRFSAVSQGQVSMDFLGDLTRYAVNGAILEFFGNPLPITGSVLAADGMSTTINLGLQVDNDYTWAVGLPVGYVRISTRPVHNSGDKNFHGYDAMYPGSPYQLVQYGLKNGSTPLPGKTLVPGSDFTIDTSTENVLLLPPLAIGPNQSWQLYRTDISSLAPYTRRGRSVPPRIEASFSYYDVPSASNGVLGSGLVASYTFNSPDSFYTRTLTLNSYVAETANLISAAYQNGGQGPILPSTTTNWGNGTQSYNSVHQDLVSKDRVARSLGVYYNDFVSSFEQIEETINGEVIGDRNGKIKTFVGTGNQWVPPGYEDPVTGAINPRYVWFDVWEGFRSGLSVIRLMPTDPVIDPITATTDSDGNPIGTFQDSATFSNMQSMQRGLVRNDVDDVVLNGRVNITRSLSGFITFSLTGYGQYTDLGSPSVYSRLFPQRTSAFTTTAPGIGADGSYPGVYSAGKLSIGSNSIEIMSTNGTNIGPLENPVLGSVKNILSLQTRPRLARARVWQYSPVGFPDIDMSTAGRPCILAVMVPVVEIPTVPETGVVETKKFASQSMGPVPSGIYDITTGDPTLHIPPFKPGDQISLGKPDGTVYGLGYNGTVIPINSDSFAYAGVFVESISHGCVITLASVDGSNNPVSILDSSNLVQLTAPADGKPVSIDQGDTVLVVPTTGSAITVSNPPTAADLQKLIQANGIYKTGTDIGYNSKVGALVDITLPSFSDPTLFGLKEITGQNPPQPMTTLEALLDFENTSVDPALIPALNGGKTLDNGDYSNPYYSVNNSELQLLGEAQSDITVLIMSDSLTPPPSNPAHVAPYVVQAVYPDEILDNAGVVSNTNPSIMAALSTTINLHPASGVYPSPGHAGIGNLDTYDLVFLQEGTGVPGISGFPAGSTGITSVGAVTYGSPSLIEPPRFASPVSEGTLFDMSVNNIQTWVGYPTYASGIVVKEDTTIPGTVTTTFDITSLPTGDIVFDDGAGGGALMPPVGGYNDFLSKCQSGGNVRIKLINKIGGVFVPGSEVLIINTSGPGASVMACTFTVSGDNGITNIPVSAAGLLFGTQKLTIVTTTPFFNFTSFNPFVPGPGITVTNGFHDFANDISGISTTYSIGQDRLTITGTIDTRTAQPRGFTHPAGSPGSLMECEVLTGTIQYPLVDTTSTIVNGTSDIAAITRINGGVSLSFLARSTLSPSLNGVGWFSSTRGHLKTMAWEGKGNHEINATSITFSAAPSSRQDVNGAIFNGVAVSGVLNNPADLVPYTDNRFIIKSSASVLTGDLKNILPGDIITVANCDPSITVSTGMTATGKCGTGLVKYSIPYSDPSTPQEYRETLNASAGSDGWLSTVFPVVSGSSLGSLTLTISGYSIYTSSYKDIAGTPVTVTSPFTNTGRVYVILNGSAINNTSLVGVLASAAYTGFNQATGVFSGLGTFQDGDGGAITAAVFYAALSNGQLVSGMTLLPVQPEGTYIPSGSPGYVSSSCLLGFRNVEVSRGSGSGTWAATVTSSAGTLSLAAHGTMTVYQYVPLASTSFLSQNAVVHNGVPGILDIGSMDWSIIRGAPYSTPNGKACLLPGDVWTAAYSAASGVYVEPSFPRSDNDLGSTGINIVDAANSLTSTKIGNRVISEYTSGFAPVIGNPLSELCQIEIKRVRRFHGINEQVSNSLQNLRYPYEIRRGIVLSTSTTSGVTTVVATPVDSEYAPQPIVGGKATQLGDFTNPAVNINPGDELRILDTNGNVIVKAVISGITGPQSVQLSTAVSITSGNRFEVYLKTPLVPHEQSCEELLSDVTEKTLLTRVANYTTQSGGQVSYIPNIDPQVAYNQSVNILSDTDGTVDYINMSIAPGDIVIVDPAGPVQGPTGPASPPERGYWGNGDTGISIRAGIYSAGSPTHLDDNRGYYFASTVSHNSINVTASGNGLAGDILTGDVTFGNSVYGYAVYPTIHGSNLSGTGNGREGQMDLRPTSLANPGTNSFSGFYQSICPFSYKIIRPVSDISHPTLELILSTRERTLSWMDKLRGVIEGDKGGSYWVFQNEQQIKNLGITTNAYSGSGLITNPYIMSLIGLVYVSPFANSSDCLSILDRRFWGLDTRLDDSNPPYGSLTPYTNFAGNVGRPVLPDRIEQALNQRDKLRATRYAWLSIRVNRSYGTLAALKTAANNQSSSVMRGKVSYLVVKST